VPAKPKSAGHCVALWSDQFFHLISFMSERSRAHATPRDDADASNVNHCTGMVVIDRCGCVSENVARVMPRRSIARIARVLRSTSLAENFP